MRAQSDTENADTTDGALDEIDAAIIDLRRKGLSQRDIAKLVGVGNGTVSYRIRRINASLPEAERIASHARRRRSTRTWSDAQLVEAVATGNSVVDCIRALGLSDRSARNWQTVKAAIADLNLSTSHWVRNHRAPGARIPLSEILVEGSTYSTHSLRLRLLDEGVKEHRCEDCQRTEWQGEPIPLELEHINGTSNDHRLENLMLLCPNCHALTLTWRGRKNRRHRCVDCNTGVSHHATRCKDCAYKDLQASESLTKIDWPSSEVLVSMVGNHGYSGTGRILKVSDNAVKKRLTTRPPKPLDVS